MELSALGASHCVVDLLSSACFNVPQHAQHTQPPLGTGSVLEQRARKLAARVVGALGLDLAYLIGK